MHWTIIASFHLSKLIFTGIEDVVHAGPILSVEYQADPALFMIVISTQKCSCHDTAHWHADKLQRLGVQ